MVQKYLKPHKLFVSRTLIKEELKLRDKEFDELVTLVGVYPYVPKEKQKVDRIQDFFYRMADYEKIKNSEVLKTFRKNKRNLQKKEKFENQGLLLRAEKISEEEYNYVDLVHSRFKSFGKAVDELSSSLSSLCLSNKLNLDDEAKNILEDFKEFVIDRGLLKKAFMSKKGFYYEVNINNVKVIWLNPYNGINLDEIIEITKDEPIPFKWSEYNFLHYASESEEESDEEDEYIKSDKLDVSLLSYAIPLQKYHIKLVLHRLKNKALKENNEIFRNTKFSIFCENLKDDLSFVIKSCQGTVVDNLSFDICLGENFDEILEDKIYCHPQYIFDSLNFGSRVDIKKYLVGKKIPKHVSPFRINNFLDPDILTSLSKNKRNKLQDIIDGFDDVHYKEKANK